LPKLLQDVRFYAFLLRVDLDLTLQTRLAGCPLCGGPLHTSRFGRKLRGVPLFVARRFGDRQSLCCARHGCRKRATPPSVVFLSRKLYPFVVVVLVGALREALTLRRLSRLSRTFEVSPETVTRWRNWWMETFTEEGHLAGLRGLTGGVGDLRRLLRSLRGAADRLHAVLLLLSPLSTGTVDRKLAWRWALRIRRGCSVPGG
jgi:hypothetical protein